MASLSDSLVKLKSKPLCICYAYGCDNEPVYVGTARSVLNALYGLPLAQETTVDTFPITSNDIVNENASNVVAVTAVKRSIGSNLLFTCGWDGYVAAWVISGEKHKGPQLVKRIRTHTQFVKDLAVLQQGGVSQVVSVGNKSEVCAWTADESSLTHVGTDRSVHRGTVNSVVAMPEVGLFATLGSDCQISLWTVNPFRSVAKMAQADKASLLTGLWIPSYSVLLVSSADCRITVWQVSTQPYSLSLCGVIELPDWAQSLSAYQTQGKPDTIFVGLRDGSLLRFRIVSAATASTDDLEQAKRFNDKSIDLRKAMANSYADGERLKGSSAVEFSGVSVPDPRLVFIPHGSKQLGHGAILCSQSIPDGILVGCADMSIVQVFGNDFEEKAGDDSLSIVSSAEELEEVDECSEVLETPFGAALRESFE